MPHTQALVPVLPSKELRSWPKHAEGGRAEYTPLDVALTRDYPTDAHFAAYSVPAMERRLALDALRDATARARLTDGVAIVMFVADVDCAAAHKGDPAAADMWWLEQQERVAALLAAHPGGFVYRTRGGYRIVYLLPAPVVLKIADDADRWSEQYCGWLAYLRRVFGIVGDHACRDWTRLFRLPHATRGDGGRPERLETIGNASAIGTWLCELTSDDRKQGKNLHKRKVRRPKERRTGTRPVVAPKQDGVLLRLFRDRGDLGPETSPGVFAVPCPNEGAHTTGARLDGSTVLFPPGVGEVFGHVFCHHAHCTGLTLAAVLRSFDPVDVAAAREAVGAGVREVQKAAQAAALAEIEAGRVTVLVPGPHARVDGSVEEVGTAHFTTAVIAVLPDDALYRRDFVVGRIVGAQGEKVFAELDDAGTRRLVDTHVRLVCRHLVKGELVEEYVACTRDLATLVRSAAGESPKVRALKQIARFPTYLPGFVLAKAGWNPTGGVYYDEPEDLVGLVPHRGVLLVVLADLIHDWPFTNAASRENTYGLMLTAVLRPAIEGPAPLHLVMASLERTGKGKLIDTTLGCAVLGHGVPMIQLGTEEAEREKRITSLLLRGDPGIHLDNLTQNEPLDSAALASMATAWPSWGGRILGVSRTPQIPNLTTWVASGNNVQATGELVKRGVPIFLQPKDEHPELRTDFLHEDPFEYALLRRRTILEALLGAVEDWKDAGRPGCDIRMGGFERWIAAVGGVLRHAGAKEWMSNYTSWITSADDTQIDAEVLVNAWHAAYGTAEVTTAELFRLVEQTGAFRWVLAKQTLNGSLVAFAKKVLISLVNRPVKGWIVRRATSGSSATYFLEKGA